MTEEEILKDPDCNVDELKKKFDGRKVYVIDVRNPHELEETGKIPGALNVPCKLILKFIGVENVIFQKILKGEKKSLRWR